MRNHFDDEDEDDEDVGSIRRRHPPRHPIAYDDDDEDYDDGDPEDGLVDLLRRIEDIRDKQDVYLGNLNDLLAREPELREKYRAFIQQGGVSSRDFERFLLHSNVRVRPRITRSRKHLRLVSSTKAVKRSSRPRLLGGGNNDDAA